MVFIWRKLPADTRFDLSLDWQFILPLIAMLTKEPKMPQPKCVLRTCNTAKCDCGRGSAPDPCGKAYSVPLRSHGGATGKPGEHGHPKFWLGGLQCLWPRPVYLSILFVYFLKWFHHMSDFKVKMHQIRLSLGLPPDP